MHRKSSAFTLIELLVVIAIISMLLAIIAPSLKLAQERAQMIICRANLRSYGLATNTYVNDNNDTYMSDCWTALWDGDNKPGLPDIFLQCQWHDARVSPDNTPQRAGVLWAYMNAQKAHMCPTFKRFARVHGANHPQHNNNPVNVPIDPQYAFSLNVFLGSLKGTGVPWGVKKESEVVNPGETLVWVEETIWLIPGWAGWTLNDTCFFSRHDDDPTQWGDFIATYHSTSLAKPEDGKGEAVFVDGHVELLDPYYVVNLAGGKQARAGFIHSWPLKGKLSPTIPYVP